MEFWWDVATAFLMVGLSAVLIITQRPAAFTHIQVVIIAIFCFLGGYAAAFALNAKARVPGKDGVVCLGSKLYRCVEVKKIEQPPRYEPVGSAPPE